jgi:chemotaxis signal transduction protein
MTYDPNEHFLVALLGAGQRLFELSRVREIVPAMQLSDADQARGPFRGFANVRGEVVPVFDPSGEHQRPLATQLIVIARRDEGSLLGVLVDDVVDIVMLPSREVGFHPAGNGRFVRAATVGGRLLSVLTLSEVLDAA